MNSVDNRVVKMTFDNAQFEKKIRETINTLKEFDKSLKFDGASAGFDSLKTAANNLDMSAVGKKASDEAKRVKDASGEAAASISEVNSAAQNVDFSPISNSATDAANDTSHAMSQIDMTQVSSGVDDAAQSFSAFETVAVGALLEVGSKITDFVTGGLASIGGKVKEFALDPIIDGFKEYETQIGSIQTILANTGMDFNSDDDIDIVNDRLRQLNEYADKTIYNFTEMTRNIGTFTAAGVDLDTSVQAIQGIANLAALSGSNSQQASTAMYQLSQALASGTVKLQDWNSVVNAGMGGEVFQEALKRTARAHHVAVDDIIAQEGSFRESLQAGWLSSEILTDTLNQMAISYDKVGDSTYKYHYEQLKGQGYSDEEAKEILRLAKAAEESATQVRTWSQLWDTVKESIGSNWAQIWQNVLGTFKDGTELFTYLSKTMTGAIDGVLGGLVHLSDVFNKSGARELLFGGYLRNLETGELEFDAEGNMIRIAGAIDNLINAISKPLQAIKEAFDSIFSIDDDQLSLTLISLMGAFNDFTSTLIISDSAAESIKQVFEGLFSILKLVFQVVADGIAVFFRLVDVLRTFLDPALDIVLSLFGQVGKVVKWASDRFLEVRAAVIEMLQPISDAITVIQYLVSEFFGFVDIPGKINLVGDGLVGILDILWKIVDLPGKIRFLGEVLGGIFNFIGDITGWNAAVAEVNKHFEETGEELSIVDVWVKKLLDNPIINFFNGIKEAILNAFPPLRDFFNAMFSDPETRDNTLKTMWDDITNSITNALGPLVDFMTNLGKGLFGAVGLIGQLVGAIGGFAFKLGEAFLAWEPIQGIISKLNEFKDGAINFFLSLPDRIAAMTGGLSSSLGGVQGIFGGVIQWFNDTINYFNTVSVEQFLEDLRDWANGIIENVKGVFDYFTHVSPEDLVKDFVETIENTLSSIDDAIIGFIGSVFNPTAGNEILNGYEQNIYGPCKEAITSFGDWLGDIASRSNSIPEFFGNVFSSIKDIVFGKLGEIKSYFENFDLKAVFAKLVTDFYDLGHNIYDALYGVAQNIEQTFPALSGVLTGGLENVKNTIKGFIDGIVNFLSPIIATSKDIPDFFGKLFGAIVGKIKSRIDEIGRILASFTPQVFLENAINIGDIIHDTLLGWFPDLQPQIDGVYYSIRDFFTDINKDASNWGDVFLNIIGKIGEGLSKIPEMLSPVFEALSSVIVDAIGWILDRLSNLPGPLGQFFGGLRDNLLNAKDIIVQNAKEFPIKFAEMFGSIGENVDKALQNIARFWEGFGIQDIPDSAGSIFDTFKKFIGGKFDELSGFVATIPNKFGDVIANFQKVFNEDTINKIVDIIQKVLIGRLVWSLADFVKGLGGLASGIGRYLKKDTWESVPDKLKKIAIALGILAASMYIISKIPDPQGCANILWELAGMLLALGAVGGLLQKIGVMADGDNLIKIAGSIGVLCLSLLAAMFTIEKLTKFDWAGNKPGIFAMIAAIGAMVGIGAFVKDGGANAMKIAGSIGILAISMRLLIPAIEELSTLDPKAALGASLLMGGFIGAMAAILGVLAKATNGADIVGTSTAMLIFAGSVGIVAYALYQLAQVDADKVKVCAEALATLFAAFALVVAITKEGDMVATSAGLLIFSAAVGVMAYALYQLAQVDAASVIGSAVALGILVVAFGGLVALTKEGDLILSATSMIIFSAAIGIMAYALYQLAQVDVSSVIGSAVALGILVVAFGGLVALTKEGDLILSATSMIIFSAAIGIMAYALYQLTQVDTGALVAATVCIGALIAIFGALAIALSAPVLAEAAVVILPLLSLAFIAFGVAAFLIAEALTIAVDAITKLAQAGPILQEFASIVAEHVLEFGAAAIGVTALGVALVVLGAGLLVFGVGATVAGFGLTLLSTGIRDFLTLIADLPELMQNAGQTISDFFTNLPQTIANVWTTFITWLTETVIPAIGEFLIGIINKLGEWLGQFWTWFTETALPMFTEAVAAFWNWFTTEGLPALINFIGEIFNKLGELLGMFWEWFTTQALPAIVQAGQDFWNWCITEGIPTLVKFIGEIMAKLGELLAQFGQWFMNEGLPAIVKAGQDFWNWCVNEGIPMLGRFIQDIFRTLGDLLMQLGSWVMSDGIPAVGRALADIMNEAGKLGGMLLDWASDLPHHILDGINSVWHMFMDAGENIVRGIHDGILGGIHWVQNAVADLGEAALDGIKNFFGIASPSKLMANDVGPYIPEGLAEGITNNGGVVYDSMYDVGLNGANGLNAGLTAGMGNVQNTINDSFKSLPELMKENLQKYPGDLAKVMSESQKQMNEQIKRRGQRIENDPNKDIYSEDSIRKYMTGGDYPSIPVELTYSYKSSPISQLTEPMEEIDISNYTPSLVTPSIVPTIDESNMPQYSQEFMNPSITPTIKGYNVGDYTMPSIDTYVSPVIDMSTFDAQMGDIGNMDSIIQSVMGGNQFNLGIDNKITDMINMPSFNINDAINDQSQMFDGQISGLKDKIGSVEKSIGSKMNELKEAFLAGHDIYMDSGSLVGSIAPQMDMALGQRQRRASRGII